MTGVSLSVQELQGLEQFIYADHSNFIHIENVYESILLQTLDKEVNKGMTVLTSSTVSLRGTADISNPSCFLLVPQW